MIRCISEELWGITCNKHCCDAFSQIRWVLFHIAVYWLSGHNPIFSPAVSAQLRCVWNHVPGHKVAICAWMLIPDVVGIVKTGHCCDSQINHNIDYGLKHLLIIYGKTDVQSKAMKAETDLISHQQWCHEMYTLQAPASLNIYKYSTNKVGRKNGLENWKLNIRSRPINTKINKDLNSAEIYFWPKFGNHNFNRWWLIAQTN